MTLLHDDCERYQELLCIAKKERSQEQQLILEQHLLQCCACASFQEENEELSLLLHALPAPDLQLGRGRPPRSEARSSILGELARVRAADWHWSGPVLPKKRKKGVGQSAAAKVDLGATAALRAGYVAHTSMSVQGSLIAMIGAIRADGFVSNCQDGSHLQAALWPSPPSSPGGNHKPTDMPGKE